MIDMTLEEIKSHFAPRTPTLEDEVTKWLPAYIFVANRGDAEGWCSSCRERVSVEPGAFIDGIKPVHNMDVSCPHCGRQVTVKHMWRGFKGLKNRVVVLRYEKSTKDPDALAARLWYIERNWWESYSMPWENTPYICADSYYLFLPGEGAVRAAPTRGSGMWVYGDWEVSHSTGSRWGRYPYCDLVIDEKSIDTAIDGTPFGYIWEAAKTVFAASGNDRLRLFEYSAKYPFAVEALAKLGKGCRELLFDAMSGRTAKGKIISWRSKTLNKVFRGRLTKADRRYILTCDKSFTLQHTLANWQMLQKCGRMLSLPELVRFANIGVEELKVILSVADIKKVKRYLDKQAAINADAQIDANLYYDYIEQCRNLRLTFDDGNLFPKDLMRQHQNLTNQLKSRQNDKYRKRFAERREDLLKYEYQDETYCIIAPTSPEDLIREGDSMHNCVGGYISRVANGKTDVVFLRRSESPDKSFVTMEIREGEIVQARAEKNCDPADAVKAFIAKYADEVLHQRRSL